MRTKYHIFIVCMLMSMKALELFAGIGGITHGLRGYVEPIAFCEYEKDASSFLSQRGLPVHGDITKFDASVYKNKIDIVTAGWPCTGFSTAGKGTGFEHEASGLWTEVVRVVKESEPKYVFLENSHVLAQTKNLKVIIHDLDILGYDTRWWTCRSNDVNVGAHHNRYRWFMLAEKKGSVTKFVKIQVKKFNWSGDFKEKQISENSHENKQLIKFMGNSVVPDQVRYAFESMSDMILEGSLVNDKDEIVKVGYSKDGIMYKIPIEHKIIPKLNIVLTPRDPPEGHKAREEAIIKSPILMTYWNTPAFCYHKSARGAKILTKRQKNNLHTQIKFCPGGSDDGYLSGRFCAWLMGYDDEYLGDLMHY
ncbi:cytosine-specific methyltransferase [Paramecium bursaria Chlorella virus NY2B]|nr:cytosine-specific methyltransferase [Paramecium bursaria Chlorella virus NY2B]